MMMVVSVSFEAGGSELLDLDHDGGDGAGGGGSGVAVAVALGGVGEEEEALVVGAASGVLLFVSAVEFFESGFSEMGAVVGGF